MVAEWEVNTAPPSLVLGGIYFYIAMKFGEAYVPFKHASSPVLNVCHTGWGTKVIFWEVLWLIYNTYHCISRLNVKDLHTEEY